jgi:hypothetical protein
MYAHLAGYGDDLSKIPKELADDTAAMAAEIAKMADARDAAGRADDIYKHIVAMSKTDQKIVTGLMSGNLSKMSASELDNMDYTTLANKGVTADKLGYSGVESIEKLS